MKLQVCGEVDPREGRKVRQSHTESLVLKPGKRDQAVRSADRFAKVSVSPRRNGHFAAGSESRSRFLNDPNEEIGSLQRIGSHANQIGPSRKVINPSDHGLVLLEGLSVAVLIQP